MRRLQLLPLCSLFLLLAANEAKAVDPDKRISQYAHTAWRMQEGAFQGVPQVITQTTDGYLWIGTLTGLLRFDGVRFVEWKPPDGKTLPSTSISSLLGARDGSLWIGSARGMAHFTKSGDLVLFPSARGNFNSIHEDGQGNIWGARSNYADHNGPVCEFTGDRQPRCYGAADGVPYDYGTALIQDALGNIWVGAGTLCRWKPGPPTIYFEKELKQFKGYAGVQVLAAGQDGSLWAGLNGTGSGLGLQQFLHSEWKDYSVPGMNGTELAMVDLLVDHGGTLWVATSDHGIYRVHHGQADHFQATDGLSSDRVEALYQDAEGSLWVATNAGIDRFRDFPVTTFSTREGMTAGIPHAVLAAHDGTVWIGNKGELEFFRNNVFAAIRARQGLPGQRVGALLEDHAGRLWVGIDDELNMYSEGHFKRIAGKDRGPIGSPLGLVEDTDRNIWVLTGVPHHLFRVTDMKAHEEPVSLPMSELRSLAADTGGGILLGLKNGDVARYQRGQLEMLHAKQPLESSSTGQIQSFPDGSVLRAFRSGMQGWRNGKAQTLTMRNGLPCDEIFSFVTDTRNTLWLSASCGYLEIAEGELQKWWIHPDAVLKVRTLGVLDGALPSFNGFSPAVSRAPDGRLWFSNGLVLQVIDPAHLATNAIPPPVHIEAAVADRITYSPHEGLRLPPNPRDIELDYTATSFVAPQGVHFRYMLENRDADWQDPGTRRQAFYSDLRPSHYRFHVIASNNDGVWNETGATLGFNVAPAWFQTTWFRLLCVTCGLLLVSTFYRIRVRQIAAAIGVRFDERLAERTRLARELHDTLLQTIQASKLVADDTLEPLDDPSADALRMRRAMWKLSDWLGQATQEGREALDSLRTSTTEENDLAASFRRASEQCLTPNQMELDLSVTGESRDMHPIVRDEIYRIGYEAIRNACNHSMGSLLEVVLDYGPDFSLRISDNGKGMEPIVAERGRQGHYGLQGMRERAARINGKLSVVSSADSGTEVSLIVPGNLIFRKQQSAARALMTKMSAVFKADVRS